MSDRIRVNSDTIRGVSNIALTGYVPWVSDSTYDVADTIRGVSNTIRGVSDTALCHVGCREGVLHRKVDAKKFVMIDHHTVSETRRYSVLIKLGTLKLPHAHKGRCHYVLYLHHEVSGTRQPVAVNRGGVGTPL